VDSEQWYSALHMSYFVKPGHAAHPGLLKLVRRLRVRAYYVSLSQIHGACLVIWNWLN